MISPKVQPVVTMTGFVKDPQQQSYKEMITKLDMRFTPQLFEETDILIVNDVCNEKYKIAKAYNPPITCVSIDWLLDSQKKNKIISTEQYQIKKIFHGAYIKIIDFTPEKSKKIENLIKENGGIPKVISKEQQLKQMRVREQKVSVVITNNFAKLKPFLRELEFPIVGVQWLQQCLKSKICKYPVDYSLNYCYIAFRQPKQHTKKMKIKIENYILSQPNVKLEFNYLENTYIHIADNVNKDLAKILKKLIMVLGGYYIDTISPVITHILTESLTEIEYGWLNIHGSLIYILRIQWLIDSIYLYKKMDETDYFIRSYKTEMMSLSQRNSFNAYNSLSINTFGSQLALNNRRTISTAVSPNFNKKTPRQIKAEKKTVSDIFKTWNFYVQSFQKKEIELLDVGLKIAKNGGQVSISRVDIKEGHCFYVLKDSSECVKMLEQLKKDTRGRNIQLQPVSYRWINECISKGQFIDFYKTQSYIYKPFNFKTPIIGFHKMIFDVLGLDDITKLRLKELYNTLGSVKNTPNRVEITHCLCGQKYKEFTRYKEIIKENSSVKLLNWNWLIECAGVGKIVQMQKYVMEKESASSVQSENSIPNHIQVAAK